MGILARELAAYQAAVDRYNQQVKQYNGRANNYNASIVRDPNGNAVVRDAQGRTYSVDAQGHLTDYSVPNGQSYGATPLSGDPNYQLLRQHPTSQSTETIQGVQFSGPGPDGQAGFYYTQGGAGDMTVLGNDYRVVSQEPDGSYTMARDTSTYPDQPGQFKGKLREAKPDPTMGQMRALGQPSLAEQERGGLIGDVIASRGLAQGSAVQYRSGLPRQQTAVDNPPVSVVGNGGNDPRGTGQPRQNQF